MIQFTNRLWILGLFAVLCFLAAMYGIFRHRVALHPINAPFVQTYIHWQDPIKVKHLAVLTGSEFDLGLEDGRRIHAVLEVKAASDSKKHVLEFLNRSKNPRVVLKEQNGDLWLVQFYVTAQDTTGQAVEIDLAKWLRDKKLAYD